MAVPIVASHGHSSLRYANPKTRKRISRQNGEQGVNHQPVAKFRMRNVIRQRKKYQRQAEQDGQAIAAGVEQPPEANGAQRGRQYRVENEDEGTVFVAVE